MPRQADLAEASEMLQSRISVLETPGAANVTLDTLSRIAAAFKVGLIVRFVPFSEMLAWENKFSQDQFDVVRIDQDIDFLSPAQPTRTINLTVGGSYQWERVETITCGPDYVSNIFGADDNPSLFLPTSTPAMAHYSQAN
jgi:hypothetical protein